MPDLGKYAVEVLSAYGVTLVLLLVFVLWTRAQGARARTEMAAVERSQKAGQDA